MLKSLTLELFKTIAIYELKSNFDIRNPISQSWKNSDFAIMGIKQFYRFCSVGVKYFVFLDLKNRKKYREMSLDANFLRLVEVRQNDDHTSSLWTRGKLEPGLLIGVLDKVMFYA
ncbi:Guanylate kinase [Dirofilaria immitis]